MQSKKKPAISVDAAVAAQWDALAKSKGISVNDLLALIATRCSADLAAQHPPDLKNLSVAALRLKLNLSQAALAKRLGKATITIQSWERGVNPPDSLALEFLLLLTHQHPFLELHAIQPTLSK